MQDPDVAVVASFLNGTIKNEGKSAEAGRPIYEDMEQCQLRYPGSKNVGVYPALGFSHWATDPETGEQVKVTYAERFPRQYQQFKAHVAQTKSGTPLAQAPFVTEARRAELRALNIYTVEALAAVDGFELKNLGFNGRELKNQAIEYIEATKSGAPSAQLTAMLEALQARNALLEEDIKLLKAGVSPPPVLSPEDDFENMTLEQLRIYIEANSGQPPQGAINRKTLIRMARGLKEPEAVA